MSNAAATAATAAATKIALVSGGNKGIGYAIVKQLAQHPNVHVLLGSRNQQRGEEAVKSLLAEQKKSSSSSSSSSDANIEWISLDIDDEKSIESAAQSVKQKYGGLDILVNNAGMAFKGDAFDENVARTTLKTNYFGTLNMCHHFLPLMRSHGRFVTVSSMAAVSALKKMSSDLRSKFLNKDIKEAELTALMNQFIDDVAKGDYADKGWPKTAYGVSKVGCSILTRILARDNKIEDMLINCCCPGWVKTDMAGMNAQKTPDEGAETPIYLCFLPKDSPVGQHWSDKEIQSLDALK